MECPAGIVATPAWRDRLRPCLEQVRCTVEDDTLYATDVGVPTWKHRVFVVVIKRRPDITPETSAAKLALWKLCLQQRVATKRTVGKLLERQGHFFLKRSPEDKGVFTFAQPTIAITHGSVMGRRPAAYQPHPADNGPFAGARDLSQEEFVQLTTSQTVFGVPPSVRRTDAAPPL